MEFYEAVNTRKTTREFLKKDVDSALMKRILKKVNSEPTRNHNRTRSYIILRSEKKLQLRVINSLLQRQLGQTFVVKSKISGCCFPELVPFTISEFSFFDSLVPFTISLFQSEFRKNIRPVPQWNRSR